MELLFLGTGAADRLALPQDSDFSNPDNRRCSAAILDRKILFDCGPHILNSLSVAGIDLKEITDICVTHFHKDHFDIETVNQIISATNGLLNIWYNADALADLLPMGCNLHPMEAFKAYVIGGYEIVGLPANHEAFPQHLSVTDGDKSLFYGLDGAWLLGDTVRYMQGREYNAVILDATVGDYSGDYRMGEHNSVPMLRLMVDSMKTLNIINKNTQIILDHIAVILHKPHNDIVNNVANDGFIVAHDGLKIEI